MNLQELKSSSHPKLRQITLHWAGMNSVLLEAGVFLHKNLDEEFQGSYEIIPTNCRTYGLP